MKSLQDPPRHDAAALLDLSRARYAATSALELDQNTPAEREPWAAVLRLVQRFVSRSSSQR